MERAPIAAAVAVAAAMLALACPSATWAAADDAPDRIRFGLFTPLAKTTWPDLAATWKEAEALGFDSVWVNDHLISTPPGGADAPQLEAWTTLAALAAYTERIRIGVLVAGNTYRNPALLAKMATTVDHISNGRLILGIGAGWFEREHEAYGFRFGSARERAERLEEALAVITRLWSDERPSFAGHYYSLHDAPYTPANVQRPRPPIIVGGQGKRWIVPLVARYADGWNANESVTPEAFRERLDIIRAECRRIGRDPCPRIASKMLVLVAMTKIPLAGPVIRFGAGLLAGQHVTPAILAGSPAAIAQHIREYVDAGANEIIVTLLPPYDRDDLRKLAHDVIPRVRRPSSAR